LLRQLDIALLGCFVAATQQQDRHVATAREVDAIARADIQSDFRDTDAHRADVAEMTGPDTVQSTQDYDFPAGARSSESQ